MLLSGSSDLCIETSIVKQKLFVSALAHVRNSLVWSGAGILSRNLIMVSASAKSFGSFWLRLHNADEKNNILVVFPWKIFCVV